MNKSRKLPWFAAVAMSLIFASLAAAQEKTITLQVNDANQPAGGVPLYVLAGGRKFSQSTPPTGTTDNAGKFVFPPGVLSSNKPHTQMEVYEVCVNGRKAIFIIPKGSEGQLPKDTEDCKKRRIGGFYWDGGSTVTMDLALGGGVTQTGGGTVTGLPQGNPIISFQVGGGVGFKNFGGTSGERAAFLQTFPGGTFNTTANSFAGDVGASINFGPVVVGSNLWRASANTSNGSGPLQGGGTDNAEIKQQFQGISETVGVRIPLGGKASFIVHGGGNFWHVNIDTKETVASGTTTTTITNSRDVDGRGWTAGTALEVDMSRRWSVVFRWDYIPMSNAGVNVHLNEGSVGLKFRLFGLPGK